VNDETEAEAVAAGQRTLEAIDQIDKTLCSLCQKTFTQHFTSEEARECPGDFPFDILAVPPTMLPWYAQVRWWLQHPIERTESIATGFRYSVANSLQKACEADFSLAHAAMVREQVLGMSWPGFFCFVAVLMGFMLPFRFLESLGLNGLSDRLLKWFRHEGE
jgi:hypothetical protein